MTSFEAAETGRKTDSLTRYVPALRKTAGLMLLAIMMIFTALQIRLFARSEQVYM